MGVVAGIGLAGPVVVTFILRKANLIGPWEVLANLDMFATYFYTGLVVLGGVILEMIISGLSKLK